MYYTSNGTPYAKSYLDEQEGRPVQNIWTDIRMTKSGDERLAYPTQKPEALLERIINASSSKGDLVADFFCGSGTAAAVAEKLGRKWICADLGKLAIHTTRKRMIGVQRRLKANGKDTCAFEILNLGKYARQHFIALDPDPREARKQHREAAREAALLDLILGHLGIKELDLQSLTPRLNANREVITQLPIAGTVLNCVVDEFIHNERQVVTHAFLGT